MNINLSISPATSIPSNYLVVAVYEESSPSVVVDFKAFPAPHVTDRNITFLGLDPSVYKVIIFENSTAAVGGTIRHNFIYKPNFADVEIRDDLYLIADTTLGFSSAGTSYTNTSLIDWIFQLEKPGFGTLMKGIDYSFDNATGTIQLLDTPDNPTPTIEPGEKYILHFQPKITIQTLPTVSGVKLFSDVILVDSDTSLDSTIVGKAVIIAGTSTSLIVTLPDITTVLQNRPIPFMSQGGNHINVPVKTFGTDKIDWIEGNLDRVIMGQSEQFWIFKWVDPDNAANYKWRILNPDGNFKTVGEIISDYRKPKINTTFADGGLRSRAVYARLWAEVQKLDASEVVSDANWNNASLNNKAKYSVGDGSTTFRVPLLYTPGFLRGVDGTTRKPGSFQADELKKHFHRVNTGGNSAGADPGKSLIRQSYKGDGYDAQGKGSSDKGPYIEEVGGDETRSANSGVYRLIRI